MNLDIFSKFNNILDNNRNDIKNFINELNDYIEEKTKGIEVYVTKATKGLRDEAVEGYILDYQDNKKQMQSEFKEVQEMQEGLQSYHVLRYKNGNYTIDEELTKARLEKWKKAAEYKERVNLEQKSEGTDYYIYNKYDNDDISLNVINLNTGYKFSLENFDLTSEQFKQYKENDTLTYKDGKFVLKRKNDDATKKIAEQYEQEGAKYYLKSEDEYGFEAINLNTGLNLRISKFNFAGGYDKDFKS